MDLVALAARLIDTPSVTGNEARVNLLIENVCTEAGFRCERQPVAEGRWNLFVNWEGVPDVVFSTHTDTVPPYLPSRVAEGVLYGRGACDTKGIIAAMLAAGAELARTGTPPAFLFVVGEETDSAGARAAAATGRRAGAVVVGEPTENRLALGHKGVLSYVIETAGVAAHSAYPERGSSAVHTLLDLLADIRGAAWGDDPVLGPSTLNVGLLNGGTAANVLAEHASATVVHRIVDSLERRQVQVERLASGRAAIRFLARNEPQKLRALDGFATTIVSFGTDVPYLRAMGEPFLVGPGSIHDAHTAHECVTVAALRDAVDLYLRLHRVLSSGN